MKGKTKGERERREQIIKKRREKKGKKI